ncbi:MAG: 23S rRNA (adenine(2030)-N(6))-methyltransferase RlmJ [Treponemataceae bacterium]|nr:23S rRNA (adenine(2030)-N(6))-methyltransferase RlmJ [Treponemataceae bacterium]
MLVLESMCKKDKPFTAIDCNAGAGFYYLDDERLVKTGEASEGVMKLLSEAGDESLSALGRYISFVRNYVENGKYPGSPEIIRSFLREQDRAILMELHNSEIEILKSHISDERMAIHHRDCYEGLKALTPPAIKRGFLLMDPSYEVTSDYENAANSLVAVQKRWNVGVQCLWYPLLHHRQMELSTMLERITGEAERKGLEWFCQEMIADSEGEKDSESRGLYGSGMLFVNPPWKLKEELSASVDAVKKILFKF